MAQTKIVEPPEPLPEALRVSPSIDERVVEQFFEKQSGPTPPEPDPITTALASAVHDARANANALVELAEATYADRSRPRAAAALDVAKSARDRGANVARKIDAALAKAKTTIEDINKATAAPPAPRDQVSLQLESEIRARLAAMTRKERADTLSAAVAEGNMTVVGAALRGPALLLGMTDAEFEVVRSNYRKRYHAKEMERAERLSKAVEATERAGTSFVKLIEKASDSEFVRTVDAAYQKRRKLIEEGDQ